MFNPCRFISFPVRRTACAAVILGMLAACGTTATSKSPNAAQRPTFDTRLQLASAAIEGGDLKTAIKIYQGLSEEYPANTEILINLGNSFVMAERLDAAQPVFEKTRALDPKDLRPLIGLGRMEIKRLAPEMAIGYFRQVLETAPDNYAALNGMAVAHDLAGQHAEAQKLYQRLALLDPGRIEAKVNLGLSLISSGRAAEAIELLIGLARLPSMPPEVRHNLALAYALHGDETSAREILQLDMADGRLVENLCYYKLLRRFRTAGTAVPATGKQQCAIK